MNGPAEENDSKTQRPQHTLERTQRWMQAVVMHPLGVERGVVSRSARQHIDVSPERLHEVVLPSQRLSSRERLEIYNRAYYARLLECLREQFPALVLAVGEETFDQFSMAYLQRFPSRSYTLHELGGDFARYLAQTRPRESEHEEARPAIVKFSIPLKLIVCLEVTPTVWASTSTLNVSPPGSLPLTVKVSLAVGSPPLTLNARFAAGVISAASSPSPRFSVTALDLLSPEKFTRLNS